MPKTQRGIAGHRRILASAFHGLSGQKVPAEAVASHKLLPRLASRLLPGKPSMGIQNIDRALHVAGAAHLSHRAGQHEVIVAPAICPPLPEAHAVPYRVTVFWLSLIPVWRFPLGNRLESAVTMLLKEGTDLLHQRLLVARNAAVTAEADQPRIEAGLDAPCPLARGPSRQSGLACHLTGQCDQGES